MKKNFVCIAALLAALALVVTGCPGGGDDPGGKSPFELNWYIGLDDPDKDTGAIQKASSNTITLTPDGGTAYVRIFWDPPGEDFEKVKITFSMNPGANIAWQAAWDAQAQWGGYEYIGWAQDFVEEVAPSHFTQNWTTGSSASAIDPKTMYGICLAVTTDDPVQFTVTDVVLTGLDGSGGTPPDENGDEGTFEPATPVIVYNSGTFLTGASVKASSFVTQNTNDITVAWDSSDNEGKGAFRAEFALSPSIDLTTQDGKGYSSFVMDWSAGNATDASFNISLYFPGNRMLNKTISTGTGTFDLREDHPSWASGTDWGGAAIGSLTGFEIYSEDFTSPADLVITKISIE